MTSESEQSISETIIHNTRIPHFIYGTAWKENNTAKLTLKALHNGFTGIDTANQRKHYFEAGVGEALQQFYQQTGKQREELFLQTKFTYLAGQDDRLPYEPEADYTAQVQQSFESSLKHLGTDYLDAYILHGPAQMDGLSDSDFEVWQAMEELYRAGKVKLLGISNVSVTQLEYLSHHAAIQPTLVQNRCFAVNGWDQEIRELCRRHHMLYQGFSLLTANPALFKHPEFQAINNKIDLTPAQIVFQTAIKLGMTALTGTSSTEHMQEDLNCMSHSLSDEEVNTIEELLMPKSI